MQHFEQSDALTENCGQYIYDAFWARLQAAEDVQLPDTVQATARGNIEGD
jgi:hypothetical protein